MAGALGKATGPNKDRTTWAPKLGAVSTTAIAVATVGVSVIGILGSSRCSSGTDAVPVVDEAVCAVVVRNGDVPLDSSLILSDGSDGIRVGTGVFQTECRRAGTSFYVKDIGTGLVYGEFDLVFVGGTCSIDLQEDAVVDEEVR